MTKICILHCPPNIVIDIYTLLYKLDVQITIFKDYKYELDYMIRHRDFDVAIIDANYIYDSYDGIYLSKRLKIIQRSTLIIFISNVFEKSVLLKIANAEPFAFILYDKIKDEFFDVITRAIEIVQKDDTLLNYRKQNQIKTISLKNVLYFTSTHRTITFYCINNYNDTFYDQMDNVEKTVSGITDYFLRVNQSYLINMRLVLTFNHNSITMINGEIITISRKFRDNILTLEQYNDMSCKHDKRAGD